VLELVQSSDVEVTPKCELWAGDTKKFRLQDMGRDITHFIISIEDVLEHDVKVREVSASEICGSVHGEDNGVFIFTDSWSRTVMMWINITLPRDGGFITETHDTKYVGVVRPFFKFVVATDAHVFLPSVEAGEQNSEKEPDIMPAFNLEDQGRVMWIFNRDVKQEIPAMMPRILACLGRMIISDAATLAIQTKLTYAHDSLQKCLDDLKKEESLPAKHHDIERTARELMSRATKIMNACESHLVHGTTDMRNDCRVEVVDYTKSTYNGRPVKTPRLRPMKNKTDLPLWNLDQVKTAGECSMAPEDIETLQKELSTEDHSIEPLMNQFGKRVR